MRASTTDADERPLVELAVVAPTPSTSSPSPSPARGLAPPGFSRAVRCNARFSGSASVADGAGPSYPGNAISTTKYTAASFLPKSLFEQFRRVANCFFLVVACVSFSPLAPYRAVSVLLPLVVVVSAAMAKEAVEDWRRKQQVRAVALSVGALEVADPTALLSGNV
jgi:phospholipid-translocating ATPase